MEFSEILNSLYFNLGHLAVFFLAINVLICSLNIKKLDGPFKRFFYFLVFSLIIEISARVLGYSGLTNLPLLHLYTLGEFLLLSYFYKSILHKPSLFQQKFWYFILAGALLILLNTIFISDLFSFNPLAKTFVQLVVISYAVLYFYNLIENQSFSPKVEKSLRLVNSAVIIYYSGSLFIFMCSQISFEKVELFTLFWIINAILNIVFQVLIFWSLWRIFYRETLSST